jgi:dihydropteroate synthase
VVAEVTGWLAARCRLAGEAGIPADRLVVDPGIGFGKTLEHNLELMRNLGDIAAGRALLVGASRKRFIGDLTGAAVEDRLPGSLAALAAARRHGASLVRVHDVAASVQFLDVLAAVDGG